MTAHFDPLEYVQQLQTAGVPKAQAEVHARTLAHVVDDCVAVPADLVVLKDDLTHQISETETRLRAEIAQTEARLRQEILKVENRLRGEIHAAENRLRGEINAVEARLNIRISALEEAIASLRAEMRFHRWASGATFVLLAGIYVQLLFR